MIQSPIKYEELAADLAERAANAPVVPPSNVRKVAIGVGLGTVTLVSNGAVAGAQEGGVPAGFVQAVEGDTLWEIGEDNGRSVPELLAYPGNVQHRDNPNDLDIGDLVQVTDQVEVAPSVGNILVHTVKAGETTWDFSHTNGIEDLNTIKKAVTFDIDQIRPNQQLVFKSGDLWKVHTVQPGDTVGSIAFANHAKPSSFKLLTDYKHSLVYENDILVALLPQVEETTHVIERVDPGEVVWQIADRHDVSSQVIVDANPEKVLRGGDLIIVGDDLIIPGSKLAGQVKAQSVPQVALQAANAAPTPQANTMEVTESTLEQIYSPNAEIQRAIDAKVAAILKMKPLYEAAAQATGLTWQTLATIDFRESDNDPGRSAFAGEILGSTNPDGHQNLPTDKLQNVIAAGNFLKHKAATVYGITLTTTSSLEDLSKAALAYNRGTMYKQQGKPYTLSPYVMNGINAGYTWMKFPAGPEEPRGTRGLEHRHIGFAPMYIALSRTEIPAPTPEVVPAPGNEAPAPEIKHEHAHDHDHEDPAGESQTQPTTAELQQGDPPLADESQRNTPTENKPPVPNSADVVPHADLLQHPLIAGPVERHQGKHGEMVDIVKVEGVPVSADVALNLAMMLEHALKDGINLNVTSGWRSHGQQAELRIKNGCPDVTVSPASSCEVPTARPGESNHNGGDAVDLNRDGQRIDHEAVSWLKANAAKYGFYNLPSEPWHWSIDGK